MFLVNSVSMFAHSTSTQLSSKIRITALLISIVLFSPLDDLAHGAEVPIKPVKIMTLASQDMNVERTFFGRVSAKQSVDLAFQVAGQLFDFPAVEGARIPKGSLVAKLDQEPFTLALDRAKASKAQADRTLNRLQQLQGNGATQASIDDARTASIITAVAVRDAEYALEHATLSAPFDAVVATRSIANFSTISAGTPVVRLHDLSELRIEIDVPEVLFQLVGNDPNLEFVARFPASDTLFPVEYREVDAEASLVGQTFRVSLGLMPPEGLLLFPGASVTVIGRILNVPGGITVPATAIYKETDGRTAVMRIEGDEEEMRIVKTPVEIGVSARGQIQIMSGIETGAEIVMTGVHGLTDGMSVRRFTSF